MYGFETIGNATVTCFDGKPILTTDPWITPHAYFGSWTREHEIPTAQLENILTSRYVWFSHGHPDHLNVESLARLTGQEFLLPDHVGGRIAHDFKNAGLKYQILPDRKWIRLSPRLEVMCLSDYYQDGILLIRMGQTLLLNVNDTSPRGHAGFVQQIAKQFDRRILLKTFGYGDIDMINCFREDGSPIVPVAAALKDRGTLADQLGFWGKFYRATDIVPFSSFHAYQRSDSRWASQYTAPLEAFYNKGHEVQGIRILPAFIQYDCEKNSTTEIRPKTLPVTVKDPEEFGDRWTEVLDKSEILEVESYFRKIESLRKSIAAIELNVGGKTLTVPFAGAETQRRLRFEVPRQSLLTAVRYNIFDDLLIGNFMKTTFLGKWEPPNLGEFTFLTAKVADNGMARSAAEVARYMQAYRDRFPIDFVLHRFGSRSERIFRNFVGNGGPAFKAAKRIYSILR